MDGFIVIATDGVWDVLSNEDVVEIIENGQNQCKRGLAKSVNSMSTVGDINISMVLCDAARTKWFELVESEGVSIDDISAIILEFLPRIPDANELSFRSSSYKLPNI